MKTADKLTRWIAISIAVLLGAALLQSAKAQDQDDPPGRVARLGYLQGSVSFQPAGESEWVEAAPNRPMTTGDKLWADKDSRAQLELGSAVIYLNSNTGVSLLNLDDRTAQIELSAGSINVRVRELNRDGVFEIDTSNQAFSALQPGRYRVEASEDGSYTVVSIRDGEGESTGNGQTYTIRAGQRATFQGTNSLNAQVEDLRGPDDFDNWSYGRDRRYDDSRSSQYCSRDVVGYEDLDENGDWRPSPGYGQVWYPHVGADWAPYRDGHWAWIDPWGWTWVDDEPWGYAPFHYGRWLSVDGRWGWVPGPMQVAPVYAPALVVFVGGGPGFGGNVGWFPLGPREVYVPSYGVSREYVNRVNVSNTTVNTTTVTNVYNTTIVNKNTTINNVTYVNRNVAGAVTAVPQRAFVSAQPVARSAVAVNQKDLASAPITSRAAVAPTSNSVLGVHANTANHVAAPPAALANRQVIAKATPPPAPVPFAARQQALAAHPGQPIARQEMQRLRPANAPAAQPMVKQAPPGKPATPTVARGGQPSNAPANQPANRPGAPPANERPGMNPPNNTVPNNHPESNNPEPNRPQPNSPAPGNSATPPARSDRPPSAQPGGRPEASPPPSNRPEPSRPQPEATPSNRPAPPPERNDRPSAQPGSRPEATPPPANNRPEPNRPEPTRAEPNNRPPEPPQRTDRPPAAAPPNRPEANPPREAPPRNEPAARPPNPPPQRTPPPAESRPAPKAQPRPQPPQEKKQEPHKDEPKNPG